MTNVEHVLEKIKLWVETHDNPITRKDLLDMGIPPYHVKNAFKKLLKSGVVRPTVKGHGYILTGGSI